MQDSRTYGPSGGAPDEQALLREGRNCWRIAPASRMRMLVDGEAYFSALRDALRAARHTVFILGWDIDSRMQLTPNGPDDGFPSGLRDFLDALVRRRKGLHIYGLSWDFAMLYALEREWLPSVKLDWQTHRRLSFRLDGNHPTGASHHQKIVVIDQRLAFVGGLDLTRCRWDTSRHAPDEPGRRDPSGHAYPPFHDVHAMVDGPAAQAPATLAEDRWHRATGIHVDLRLRDARDAPYAPLDPWPASVAPYLTDVEVAISRTAPAFDGRPAVQEIQALYLDAIASARHRLYFENQYFTATPIGDALSARLATPGCPDIAVVSRRALRSRAACRPGSTSSAECAGLFPGLGRRARSLGGRSPMTTEKKKVGRLRVGDAEYGFFPLADVQGAASLPFSLKVLLENLLRNEDGENVTREQIEALGAWDPEAEPDREIQFTPARVLLQARRRRPRGRTESDTSVHRPRPRSGPSAPHRSRGTPRRTRARAC